MGAGRRTTTYSFDSASAKGPPQFRCLPEEELGGVIFGATRDTIDECIDGRLFGLPRIHYEYVKNIRDGMPLFLFNYSDRTLFGVYEADGSGDLDLDPTAWASVNSGGFPAQVRVRVRTPCKPLTESVFGPALTDNYFQGKHFMFELDRKQVDSLFRLFGVRPKLKPQRPPSHAASSSSSVPNAWVQKPLNLAKLSEGNGNHSNSKAEEGGEQLATKLRAVKLDEKERVRMEEEALEKFRVVAGNKNNHRNVENNSNGSIGGYSDSSHNVHARNEQSRNEHLGRRREQNNPSSGWNVTPVTEWDPPHVSNKTSSSAWAPSDVTPAPTSSVQSVPWWTSPAQHHQGAQNVVQHPPTAQYGANGWVQGQVQHHQNIGDITTAFTTSSSPVTSQAPLAVSNAATAVSMNQQMVAPNSSLNSERGRISQTWNGEMGFSNPGGGSGGGVSQWEAAEQAHIQREQETLRKERMRLQERMQAMDPLVAHSIQMSFEIHASVLYQMRQDSLEMKKSMEETKAKSQRLADLDILISRNTVLENNQVVMMQQIQALQHEVGMMRGKFNEWVRQEEEDEEVGEGEKLGEGEGEGGEGEGEGGEGVEVGVRDVVEAEGGGAEGKEEGYEAEIEVENKVIEKGILADSTGREITQRNDFLGSQIFFMGGYKHEKWIDTVVAFSPERNHCEKLSSMSRIRSCAASAVLNSKIFVFGGGDGENWYDSAEAYNRELNVWVDCAPLQRSRGSLAGAVCMERLYALGGGDGTAMFHDVECFTPALNAWMPAPPMQDIRFCMAAAEVNGSVYALGGYNGSTYLQSMERLDPREGRWMYSAAMACKRGSLAAAVLRGKIYSLGGFDGARFLDSVECYEPRTNTWQIAPSMASARAYGGAAVVGDYLYAIGGLSGQVHIEKIERFSEASQWEEVDVGEGASFVRSFLTVAVL